MDFLLGFSGAFIGIIVAIIVVVLIIVIKVNKTIGTGNLKTLFSAMKNAKELEMNEYAREKNVSGITKLIEPSILKDFPEFNKNVLYSKVESNLTKIFNAIENKDISKIRKDNDLLYVLPIIEQKIEDLKSFDISIFYDAIKFHEHAIKNYTRQNGIATVTISSTVEYYYTEKSNDRKKISKSFNDIKKQTRYTTDFVYVYDESKFDENQYTFGLSCPNCGAPLKRLDLGSCEYCSSHFEPINLKIWKMSSYKEDYK